jgi:hypothetical protein
MTFVRTILGAIFVFTLAASAAAQECTFGQYDGERGYTYREVPYYWLVHVFTGVARATGVATVSGYGASTKANTFFEIGRGDAAARKSKTYKSFITIDYFPEAPPPRSLKAKLDIGGSTHEFAVEEKAKDRSTSTIDLAPLYPALIAAIRKGELAHLTILDRDKTFIEQYFRGTSLKIRFVWMEGEMERIFAAADAGNCPEAPKHAPISGGGSVHSF